SLGNSPDALKLIENYGADGVRVGLLLSSSAGNDLMFDEALCKQGKAFGNKIWNAFRLIKGWKIDTEIPQPESASVALEWYRAQFQKTLAEIEFNYEKYRISDVLMSVYKLLWDDFCSWLLEAVKPKYGQPVDAKTFAETIALWEDNLKILHPFMPFLTEEIWQNIASRKPEEALVISSWPKNETFDDKLISSFGKATEVVTGIRGLRKQKNISHKESLELFVLNKENLSTRFDSVISKLGNLSKIEYVDRKIEGAFSFRIGSNEYFIPLQGSIDIEAEKNKLLEELSYQEGFLKSVEKKLSNERFVNNAPEKVVEMEVKKKADAEAKIKTIKESLKTL